MVNTIPEINNRIKQIIEVKTFGNVSKFADITGFSQQKLNRLFTVDTRTEKYPTATLDIVMKITEMFVDVDPDWLLMGKGDMYRVENSKNTNDVTVENGNINGNENGSNPKMQKKLPYNSPNEEHDMVVNEWVSHVNETEGHKKYSREEIKSLQHPNSPDLDRSSGLHVHPYLLRTDRRKEMQIIPIYNMEASAGLVHLLDNPNSQNPIDYISIPNLPNCDGALFVTGDSMYPLLKSGDIVAYKNVQDIKNDIFWGEMYLVSLDMSGEELVTIKYVQKSEKAGHIKLVSQNKHHQDKDVRLSKIRALALIKASIRYNLLY